MADNMPPRAPVRNPGTASVGDDGHRAESRRKVRPHQPSRFAREKPLSPRASQSLKFKDKGVKPENHIRPPHADLPLKFVQNADKGYVIQARHSVSQQQPDHVRSERQDELIKYMSKVPKYLQQGEKVQGNVLNFGVLDWGRLEQWTYKQSKGAASFLASDTAPSAVIKPETSVCQRQKPNSSHIGSAPDFGNSPVVRPIKERAVNLPHIGSSLNISVDKHEEKFKSSGRRVDLMSAKGKEKGKKQEKLRKCKSVSRDGADVNFAKGKGKYLNQDTICETEISASKLGTDHDIYGCLSKNTSNQDAESFECFEKFERLGRDSSGQYSSGKQESIVLILPKDFSQPSSSELPQEVSPHRKSGHHNWGSFSDIFSIGEINPDDSFSDFTQPCHMDYTVETERDLDVKLEDIINAQGVELPTKLADIPSELNSSTMKGRASTSSVSKTCSGSLEMNRDSFKHNRLSFGIGKLSRSLSFRESSSLPPRSSIHVPAKSGPAKPEGSAASETSSSNDANVNGRARASPFRRLLDPLRRSMVANQKKEQPDQLRMNPSNPIEAPADENYEPSTTKALLHLTVKSGLPLFKFVVEINNEILASTVKSLSTLGKDDMSWLYTFYSVHKVRKKSGRWKNQKVKPCELGYNVVGQMKVSKPYLPSSCIPDSAKEYKLTESVLCSVDSSNQVAGTSEFVTGRELAAVIVKMSDESGKNCGTYSELFGFEDEKLPETVVILPGGDHSLPHEGVPSSLINRWRTGGLCDCGGWDEGCKLRVLNDEQDSKALVYFRSRFMDVRCDLFDQGGSNQNRPFFRLVPFRDGLFSVEFDAKMSSLQAFSICVAVINSKQPALTSDASHATHQVGSKQEFSRIRVPVFSGEGPESRSPHPPLSPVGRV